MIVKANTCRAAEMRKALKERGVRANVRCFNWQYRIVLRDATDAQRAELRDYLVENNIVLPGGVSATDPAAYARAWSLYEGRGQIFVSRVAT